jgi:hypothetical protein
MDMVLMGPPGAPPYRVGVETVPREVEPGKPFRLRLVVTHPTTGERVKELGIVHEMPFHLFIVSGDLAYYDHIHPKLEADGAFVVDTEFPRSGEYNLFCDFLPLGGLPQVIHKRLATVGFARDRSAADAADGRRGSHEGGRRNTVRADARAPAGGGRPGSGADVPPRE